MTSPYSKRLLFTNVNKTMEEERYGEIQRKLMNDSVFLLYIKRQKGNNT